jgi:prepilin-type N-terminal cleavage/methylation domain-containing protein
MSYPMMHRNRSGFSMLEMTITTMIIGILCVAAVPKLQQSLEGQRVEAASRQFFAELQSCRSIAIRENRRIRVMPTTGSFAYQIRRFTAAGAVLSTETVNLSTTAQNVATFDAFSAPPNAYLEINHRGEISAASGDTSGLVAGSIASVRFRSGSRTKTVQISPAFAPLP